jgi:hypothetical protein
MLGARIEATSDDLDNFRNTTAGSAEGRAYGLRSNASRRRRAAAY